jgi:flagellar biosynthesis protein FlhG
MTVSPPGNDPRGNVLAVASGKGGVGKTWLAITLAHAYARQGARVLLFDADLGLANIDIQLGLVPRCDLAAVVAGRAMLAASVETFAEGFDIIAGRSGSGGLAALGAPQIAALGSALGQIAAVYDRVVVDLGAGVGRTVRLMAGLAATTLVVTTDEPTAMTDAYAFMKVARADRPDADLRIVVNRAGSLIEGERSYLTLLKAAQHFLGYGPPLAGIVREDPKVRDTIRAQAPLLPRSAPASASPAPRPRRFQPRRLCPWRWSNWSACRRASPVSTGRWC